MPDNAEGAQTDGPDASTVNKNKRYRKPKPWDTDDIDHVLPYIEKIWLNAWIVEN